MIAAVTGCHAAIAALLLFAACARAAGDPAGAARELARKTASVTRAEAVSVAWQNLSSLTAVEVAQTRASFDEALQSAGGRLGSDAAVMARITISQNASRFLLIEEVRAPGGERLVWIASWNRPAAAAPAAPAVSLQSKLVWRQPEPILDAALLGDAVLVLSPARIVLGDASTFAERQSAALAPVKPQGRDPRGLLRVTADSFRAFLPGTVCAGAIAPALSAVCRDSGEPWVLDSGSRAMLLANFAPARNYFDGGIVTQAGARKTAAPFFSAAAVDSGSGAAWLFATLDGRIEIRNSSFEPAGSFADWGSDLAVLAAGCGAAAPVLATKPGDGSAADAVQAFSLSGPAPVPLTAPLSLAGRITALWPDGDAALAVVHDSTARKYSAYVLTLNCGP